MSTVSAGDAARVGERVCPTWRSAHSAVLVDGAWVWHRTRRHPSSASSFCTALPHDALPTLFRGPVD
eukprot:6090117-Prymnesium_polylepis.2